MRAKGRPTGAQKFEIGTHVNLFFVVVSVRVTVYRGAIPCTVGAGFQLTFRTQPVPLSQPGNLTAVTPLTGGNCTLVTVGVNVTAFTLADAGLLPAALVATTSTRYWVAGLSPPISQVFSPPPVLQVLTGDAPAGDA